MKGTSHSANLCKPTPILNTINRYRNAKFYSLLKLEPLTYTYQELNVSVSQKIHFDYKNR